MPPACLAEQPGRNRARSRGRVTPGNGLGEIASRRGRHREAGEHFAEAAARYERLGDDAAERCRRRRDPAG